jgi:DNA-binding transcriptional MocR family regulator
MQADPASANLRCLIAPRFVDTALQPGRRIPSTRSLAVELGISRLPVISRAAPASEYANQCARSRCDHLLLRQQNFTYRQERGPAVPLSQSRPSYPRFIPTFDFLVNANLPRTKPLTSLASDGGTALRAKMISASRPTRY